MHQAQQQQPTPEKTGHAVVQEFSGEFDDEGVYFYQAYNNDIADWAIKNQKLGGPHFNQSRMTWLKPAFAWVLYRSKYGHSHNQTRILKFKLAHATVAEILSKCDCKHGGGGSNGRVQWDPARDLFSGEGKVPRKMLTKRAIQIGVKDNVQALFVNGAITIEDVTDLSHLVGKAHDDKLKNFTIDDIRTRLPNERPYMPACTERVLINLALLPGPTANEVFRLGKGKAIPAQNDTQQNNAEN
eukprot:m.60888 g.60888  ORF g.60888 m.60888 type:complete len:242 (-) comp22900_c1_seq1:130-855(-)